MKRAILFLLMAFVSMQAAAQLPSISEKTDGLTKTEGYFDYYYDASKDQLWLEVDKLDTEFLYVNSLTAGVGSNDIGLDRGQLGDTRVVYFERRGPKILMVQPNYSYRAETDNELEKKSVREAFASSVIAGFEVAAEEDGKVLIDLTDFLLRDAHGVSNTLQRSNQGSYSLDKSRSALYKEGTINFPKNTEFEATLTFAGSNPGGYVRSVVPTPEALTVRQHHSFVELPDDNFEPRKMDPRAGYFGISYQDYGTPISEDLTKRFIARHRLEKKNPEAEMSEPVEPIVYYLDNGTPEPVRSALLDGARWWNQAFEAAGFKNAFIVKVLPENAHPLDVRYNVIQWVHRSTRGWSYGSSVTDPRTGEIIKGHVSLGSLRVRQDYLIAVGLLAPYGDESAENITMQEMALARIRQLSAHEVGHTLGIAHNFAASTIGDASVMDYPHPQPKLVDGEIDLSNPYDVGIGEWDKVAVTYGYQDFPEETNEEEALDEILESAYASGLKYISDADARPQSGAHPDAHLWDFGADPASQLSTILDIRKKALENFGKANLKSGKAMAELEDVLVPMYFFHRYQLEGTVKLIGGLDYSYNLKGDNLPAPKVVAKSTQQKALSEMLKAIDPEVLAVPENLLDLIPPRPSALGYSRELFNGNTGPALDALGIAETAADIPVSLILNAERANRLVEYGARDNNLSLENVLNELIKASWDKKVPNGYLGSVQRVVNHVVLKNMIELAADRDANPLTKAITHKKLTDLQSKLSGKDDADSRYAVYTIGKFLTDPEDFETEDAPAPPPGSPIGSGGMFYCEF
ncbi:zinc-dependent metalloprotease [Gracilimonas tropica]|uniref:zinc-dependent metalloprotease n=1 Tax=Gracilimonas tropica TaxID=454600 RepID=UPI00039CAD80|nr:zinc-dependent metalloprotease [Gracilimonas tropica]